MIVTESYKNGFDGSVMVRTYSDAGKYIERDGVLYEEAVDPKGASRVYVETGIEIELSEAEALAELREVLA